MLSLVILVLVVLALVFAILGLAQAPRSYVAIAVLLIAIVELLRSVPPGLRWP